MARPILLSNGELHVGINKYGLVHDFYYPYVGFENHSAGQSPRHRVGVWVDEKISWLDDGAWEFKYSYPHQSLIGHIVATNESIGVVLEFDDAVDAEFSAYIRNIHVINLQDRERDIRIFLHQAFIIGDSRSNTDTAQYLPDSNAILHYRGRRAFIISAVDGEMNFFDQYAVGIFGIEGREGTYKDAEDGELEICDVEHGRVDSTVRFKLTLPAHSSTRLQYWIACGTSTREALYIHKQILSQGIHRRLDITAKWWNEWLKPAKKFAERIDASHRDAFLRSVMIIKSHIDKRGAVIASTDTAVLNYSRDAYGYCWPRDGAHVLWPLIRMGYKDEAYRFFEFCRRVLSPGGYLMHKFRADGALGSSWHPYREDGGKIAPPIQTDETALVLFVFTQFHQHQQDEVLLKEFYEPMVMPMADFLASYVDHRTMLPRASYDLWEEQFMTTTYTVATTYAALLAAADLADIRHDEDNAVAWRAAAEDIRKAAEEKLYNHKKKAFYKGIRINDAGEIEYDETYDMSSLFGSFMFGLFPVHSDKTRMVAATALKVFNFDEKQPGLPRYENDYYRRSHDDVQGNWWYVTSLWMAQYFLEVGEDKRAWNIINWVRDNAWDTGVLAEQVDPKTMQEASVSPLAWSQAEYVSTLLDTLTET